MPLIDRFDNSKKNALYLAATVGAHYCNRRLGEELYDMVKKKFNGKSVGIVDLVRTKNGFMTYLFFIDDEVIMPGNKDHFLELVNDANFEKDKVLKISVENAQKLLKLNLEFS